MQWPSSLLEVALSLSYIILSLHILLVYVFTKKFNYTVLQNLQFYFLSTSTCTCPHLPVRQTSHLLHNTSARYDTRLCLCYQNMWLIVQLTLTAPWPSKEEDGGRLLRKLRSEFTWHHELFCFCLQRGLVLINTQRGGEIGAACLLCEGGAGVNSGACLCGVFCTCSPQYQLYYRAVIVDMSFRI